MLAIYCRTSKNKKEGQDKSIPSQKMLGAKFAIGKNWEYEYFVDEGISGTKDKIEDRPQFAEMLNLIRKGNFNAVYCIDQSRIERNTNIWNLFVGIMLTKKCEYYPSGNFFDLNIPENIMFSGMMSLVNGFYASITSRKTKLADELNAKEGKTHGITAYGYERGEKGYYQINENEAEVVKRIFTLSLNGTGTYMIANILNNEGIPCKFNRFEGKVRRVDKLTGHITTFDKSKMKWRGNVIRDLIKNSIYKGIRKWNDLEISIPAIIETDLWDKTNRNFVENKKNVGRKSEYHYLLNGLMFCGNCGMELRGKKRLKGVDRAYKCKGKRQPNSSCTESRGINIPKIETFIIKHLFKSKDLRNFLTNINIDTKATNTIKDQLDKKRNSLTKIEAKITKAYRLLLDPDYEDDAIVKEDLKKSKSAKENLEVDIKILENKYVLFESDNRKKRVKSLIDEFNIDDDFEAIRLAVHSLINRIEVQHIIDEKNRGYLIKINYRDFEECSMFLTDYQGMNWYSLGRYTNSATNAEELNDDIELANYLINESGKNKEIREYIDIRDYDPDFKGFEKIDNYNEIIKLSKEELIHFD